MKRTRGGGKELGENGKNYRGGGKELGRRESTWGGEK
jgi:hypothetical protein